MSIMFYHVFLWLYRTGIRLIAPWNKKAALWLAGRKDIFQTIEDKLGPGWPGTGPSPAARPDAPSPAPGPAQSPAATTAPMAFHGSASSPTPGSPTSSGAAGTGPSPAITTAPGASATPAALASPGASEAPRAPISPASGSPRVIWMHCSSLGEFEQGRPVIEELRKKYPSARIVISFFSPSGYEARKNYADADHVFYLPLDTPRNARKFIDLIRPDLVIWIKYDYWYYFLLQLKKRNIPTLLVSGIFRPNQPFFRWYGRLHRYMLECFTHLFVQTETSRQLLQRLGISANVTVSGDTRFDRVIEIARHPQTLPVIAAFCGDHPVIVAGSTWEEDEEEIDHYANTHPDLRIIIAPHEIQEERLREVEKLFRHSIRYSEWIKEKDAGRRPGGTASFPAPNVLIIDNIGMLSSLYSFATITYVGGGFGDDGVHNVLEAAVYGKPVITGPVIEKYIEAVELADCGGAIIIDSALEAESVFNRLLGNPEEYRQTCEASRNYVLSKQGATNKIVDYIAANGLLKN